MTELPWIFTRIDLRAMVDILSVALIFYWLLWVIQGTRAAQLVRGLAIFVVAVVGAAHLLQLQGLNWLLSQALPALIVAIPVVFQPELRRALERLGHTGAWLRTPLSGHEPQTEETIEEITRAVVQLARLRYGALIVIERETGLQDYADRGIPLDATLTQQLLVNIFFPNSPLHDGAVIIRGNRILAAGCVLPLSENLTDLQLGTRHRAGVGITEESDAIAIIVSEETSQISLAVNGRLYRNLDAERLRRALRALLHVDQSGPRRLPAVPSRTEPIEVTTKETGSGSTREDARASASRLG
ncbi:diadenylate cyclase CdaA [Thermomicrobium sp. CFH 73360]|uniref:diadenylate cyclase CdaA n=1 Tax=Thermomicrobium sp. CFH 73360 TaxID=2951987 RepID=UPI00207762C9|nr:diadenylate cyclase CdaA [Thermomicrobium sp. CFH 73360]MCM8746603.1 diadenylate cyclase CdaA [Thermomicrobium sp. CFH 73360]